MAAPAASGITGCSKPRSTGPQPSGATADQGQLGHAGCRKSFVRPAPCLPATTRATVAADTASQPLLAAAILPVQTLPATAAEVADHWPDALPPTAERLLILQRLLI
jgi:hypothetical protein